MNFDGFLRKVEAGRKGENNWIPVKYRKMRRYLGIGRKMYYLIGGQPGTGKSSYVDTTFVINPYHWYKHNKDETDLRLKIVVRSMERSKEYRIAKWVSMKLFVDHGILIDVPSMFSWGIGETKITDDIYRKIKEAEKYFHEMEDIVSVIDGLENPTGIYKQLKYWAESNGNTYRMKRDGTYQYYSRNSSGKYKWIDESNPPKEAVEAIKNPFERHYIPDDEDLIFIFVLDHIGKIRGERGHTERQNLGKMSQYVSTLRDLYGMTPVIVCQFNRGLSNPQRRIHMQHQPEESDFKGAGDMYEDADFVKGIFNPHKYQIDDHKGYKVAKFTNREGDINRFRASHLLKNTYGPDNVVFGLNFIGECGYFRQVPSPNNITSKDYFVAANLTDMLQQRIAMSQ